MKNIVLFLLGVLVCPSIAMGVFDFTISSGYHVTQWLEGDESLLMTGGGTIGIEAKDSSYVEVENTTPLQYTGGIGSIGLTNNSMMNYYGGEANTLRLYQNAIAVLQGGSIDHIWSYQRPLGGDYPPSYWDKHITIKHSGELPELTGNILTGFWGDGSAFSVELHNPDPAKYNSVMSNIEFVLVPEPVTLLLLGLGSLFLRKRKL